MVKTSDDVMDIHPLERMDRLQEIEEEKRGSIASKKKELEELQARKRKELDEMDSKKKKDLEELEKKKKELEDFEKKKAEEIEETENLIEKSFQELMRHKRQIIQKDEETEKAKSLENIADKTPGSKESNIDYGRFFEKLEPPQRLYDMINPGFYNNLTELKNKAIRGEISEKEEEFITRLRTSFDSFESNREYVENTDRNNYLQRSRNIVDQISEYRIRHL